MMIYEDDQDYAEDFVSAEIPHWPKKRNEVLIPFTKKFTIISPEKEVALQRAIDEFTTKTCIR